jgi:hypothetical protein
MMQNWNIGDPTLNSCFLTFQRTIAHLPDIRPPLGNISGNTLGADPDYPSSFAKGEGRVWFFRMRP